MSLNKRLFTAGPTSLEDAFKTQLYTGTGGNGNSVSGFGFAPDLIWLKDRDTGYPHYLYDSSRGALKGLRPSETDVESTNLGVSSFDSDGFTLDSNAGANQWNSPNCSWVWKCNGGTTSTNTDGSINSTVQVNNDTGLSIIQYTGSGSASSTVGHGLTGVPRFILAKSRSWANNFLMYLHDGTNYYHGYIDDETQPFYKNSSNTQVGTSGDLPTSSVIETSHIGTNNSGQSFMMWAWEPKDNYSKFGSYTGNGSNGRSLNIGFQPDFVLIRSLASNENTLMFDSARGNNKALYADKVTAEQTYNYFSFDSTGFVLPQWGSSNGNGQEYIYAAWRNAT